MTTHDRLRQLATALLDQKLGGPWRWDGNSKYGGFSLCTDGNGRQHLMTFVRKGMNSAQPTFRTREPGTTFHVMRKADEIPVYEVCRGATTRDDPRVYRHDVAGFRSPVADYLAAVDAETLIDLLDQIDHLEAALAHQGDTP